MPISRSLRSIVISLGITVWMLPASAQSIVSIKNDSTALLDASEYLRLLTPASKEAVRILSSLGNPVFTVGNAIAVQSIATTLPRSVTVLFPTPKQFPQYLPLLRSSGHSFCQIIPPAPPQNIHNLIVCDPDTLRQLDILIRVAYSPSYLNKQMSNDWTFMRLLGQIETEPQKVIDEVKSTVSDDQVEKHMSLILVFLLAHETWHLTHGEGTHFDSDAGQAFPSDTDLAEKLMCRNYEAFLRRGFSLFNDRAIALTDEGTTDDPAFRQTFKVTRDIWQEEEDADRFGADTLAKFMYVLNKNASKDEVYQSSYRIIENLGLMMLQIWFSKMQPFAISHCDAFSNKDFYLTLCTCQNKSIYGQVINLFGSTHPPIVLRMYTAASSFVSSLKQNVGIDLTTSERPIARATVRWLLLISVLSDVPLKLSWAQCSDFQKFRSQVENLGQDLPDLAGFSASKWNSERPGYPKDTDIFMVDNCLASPKKNQTPGADKAPK